jgi:hypothetical protein
VDARGAEAGTEGVLSGGRSPTCAGNSGTWKDSPTTTPKESNLTSQVRNIARCMAERRPLAISPKDHGERAGKRVPVEEQHETHHGDQLPTLRVRHARGSVKSAPKVFRADRPRSAGRGVRWRIREADLGTDNVNFMAGNLTSQVRSASCWQQDRVVANGVISNASHRG